MKRSILLLLPVLAFACTQKSDGVPNEDQQKKIQQEIQPVLAQLYEAAAHADSTKLFDLFSFSDPDFTYVDITGAVSEQAAYKQMVDQFWGTVTTEMIAKGKEKYIFINQNSVLWSYSGTLSLTYKTGQQATYEPFALTLLFKKKDGQWKAVFVQESTQEPPPADSTKH
jgi:ketosteroid isomerase-like protein